ncbi:MAG: sugar ABC transporter ATP-binding protein [Alphaproteobacteria bacterium]|nr:sugar ABC transporter ATP-binding protein [Alphaproteobacteria bacterium]
MTLLDLTHIAKSYGRTAALADASIDILPGEVHALMGENGAGKSTFIKVLAGIVKSDRGEIRFQGKLATIDNPQDAFDLGFRFIHQELNVVPQISVAENIAIGGPYPTRFGAMVNWRELNRRARAALARLGIDTIDPRTKISRLSAGDQMLVKIAGTLSDTGNPACLFVMDEPTASLTGEESERLFKVIAELKSAGASVLYVSHRMDEVMQICDRVTVFRDGRFVETKRTNDTDKDEIIRFMTGRDVKDVYPERTFDLEEHLVCRAQDVSTRRIRGLSFNLRKGEVLGIGGLSNAGQSEVMQALMGLDRILEGTLKISGKAAPQNPATAWEGGIAYVPRERRREGLMLTRSILQNTVLPHLRHLSRLLGVVNRRSERDMTQRVADIVRLKADSLKQPCYQLSGGNQQKVVFARAVGASLNLLLLDEPTRGVDVGAKFDIYTLVRELSARGCGVVLTSSDLPELLGMCDRILIMQDGRQTEIVETRDLDPHGLLSRFYAA